MKRDVIKKEETILRALIISRISNRICLVLGANNFSCFSSNWLSFIIVLSYLLCVSLKAQTDHSNNGPCLWQYNFCCYCCCCCYYLLYNTFTLFRSSFLFLIFFYLFLNPKMFPPYCPSLKSISSGMPSKTLCGCVFFICVPFSCACV